jgi:hypothetical protein
MSQTGYCQSVSQKCRIRDRGLTTKTKNAKHSQSQLLQDGHILFLIPQINITDVSFHDDLATFPRSPVITVYVRQVDGRREDINGLAEFTATYLYK